MMDQNEQAVDIKGYRVLSEEEKSDINFLKRKEVELLENLSRLKGKVDVNQRSLSIGITNIETGFMWAIRAIARPNGE